MNTDLNNLRADAQALLRGPLEQARYLERKKAVEQIRSDLQYESAAAQSNAAQTAGAEPFQQQSNEVYGMMDEVIAKVEDVKLKEKFQAARYDAAVRRTFGGKTEKGVPKSIAAANQAYGDTLFAQALADEFGDTIPDEIKQDLSIRGQATRNALAEAYMTNFGGTEDEAEAYVARKFGTVEDRISGNRTREAIKDSVGGFFGRVGSTLWKSVEKLGIVDQPIKQAALKTGAVMGMSDEQFKENYPEQAAKLARASVLNTQEDRSPEAEKELNWLKKEIKKEIPNWTTKFLKPVTAIEMGMKEALKEANRIFWGDPYDPAVVQEWARTVTDNEKYLPMLELFGETSTIWPMFAAEKFAANVALKTPAYAFRAGYTNKALGKLLDVAVPGRPSSWEWGSDRLKVITAQTARTAARDRAATEAARIENVRTAHDQLITDDAAKRLGGVAVDVEADEAAKILGGIVTGDYTDSATWRAGAELVRRARALADLPPEDEAIVSTIESQLKQAEAQFVRDAGKSVPSQVVSDLASDKALDRLGYSQELLHNLVQTEKEATRFHELVQEGRALKDEPNVLDYYTSLKSKVHGQPLAGLVDEREERALLHAITKFSEETGRPFNDIVVDHYTPGTFAEYVPDLDVLAMRITPARYEALWKSPAPDEVRQYFFGAEGARDWSKAVKAVERQVAGGGADMPPARTGPMMFGGKEVQGVHPEDFAEMGEVLRVPVDPNMPLEAYTDAVYQAFVNRFGATKLQIAKGPLYDDMTEELNKPFSAAQIAKVQEIVNTWRGLKWLMKKSAGTDMEENAVNLALWYRSQVANGGTSYRLIHARTEALNRAARGEANGTSWISEGPRPTDYRAGRPMTDMRAGEGGLLRSALDTDQATVRTKLTTTEENTGQVFSGLPSSEIKRRQLKPGQIHGAEQSESLAVKADDAMANARSIDDVLRDSDDAYADAGQLSNRKIAEARAADLEEARLAKVGPEGPVTTATHSMKGSYEDLYVLDLEEFAGVGATEGVLARNFKINIFHASPQQMNEILSSYPAEQLDTIYNTVINEQVTRMANRIAAKGAYPEQLTLFHRGLAVARGLREIKATGKVSASTEAWLDSMDLRAGATGMTNEEAIVNGIESATKRNGFLFTMQKNRQKVLDTRTAELYSDLTTTVGREKFIDDYAEMVTGENAVKMRREVNAAVNRMKKTLGSACK